MDSDLRFDRAFEIVLKTMPYIVYRAGIYGCVCAALAFAMALIGLIGAFAGPAVFSILLVAFLALWFAFGVRKVRRSNFVQTLQAGHIALITELATKGRMPEDTTQLEWARERVERRFKKSSVLYSIVNRVESIHKTVNRRLFSAFDVLPIPPVDALTKVAEPIVDLGLGYIDDAVLAHTFKNRHENPFEAAKNGVILYCQRRQSMTEHALRLTAYSYVSVVIVAVILMFPAGLLSFLFDSSAMQIALFSSAAVLGVAQKWILFDPVASASTILEFFRETKELEPDPDWEARIESASDEFHQLRKRAARHSKRSHHHETDNAGTADVEPA